MSPRNCRVPVAKKRTASQESSMLLSLLQSWAGVESNPITSNGGQRIDHAVKRERTMILHELRIVKNMFTASGRTSEHTAPEFLILEI